MEDIQFSMRGIIFIVIFLAIAAVLIVLVLPRVAPSNVNETLYNFAVHIITSREGG